MLLSEGLALLSRQTVGNRMVLERNLLQKQGNGAISPPAAQGYKA